MSARDRRERKAKLAAHIAAGTYVPRPRKSEYRTDLIRDSVQEDLLRMRQQIEAHRHVAMDPTWHYDNELDTKKAHRKAIREVKRAD